MRTIIVSTTVLWIIFSQYTIWKREWSLKKSGNRWNNYGICFAERDEENEDRKLVNRLNIPIVNLEKSFHPDYFDCSLEDERQRVRHLNEGQILKRDSLVLMKVLIQNVFVSDIEKLASAFCSYNLNASFELDNFKRYLNLEIMELINEITDVSRKALKHLNSETIRQLKTIYAENQATPISDMNQAIDIMFLCTGAFDTEPVGLTQEHLNRINTNKNKLQLKLCKASTFMQVQQDLQISCSKKFPLCFIKEDVKIDNEDQSCRHILNEIGAQLLSILSSTSGRSPHMVSVNRIRIRNIAERIETLKVKIVGRIDTWIHKLTKHLYLLAGGPIMRILCLFLYIFQTASAKYKYDSTLDVLWNSGIPLSVVLRNNLKKVNTVEQLLLDNALTYFDKQMETLFQINVKDPSLKVLSKRLANSPMLCDVLTAVTELVTLHIFKKFIEAQKTTLCQIEKEMTKQESTMTHSFSVNNLQDVDVPKQNLLSIIKYYQSAQYLFDVTMGVADGRNLAANFRKKVVRTVNKFRVFMDMLNLLHISQQELGKTFTACDLKCVYNEKVRKNAEEAAGVAEVAAHEENTPNEENAANEENTTNEENTANEKKVANEEKEGAGAGKVKDTKEEKRTEVGTQENLSTNPFDNTSLDRPKITEKNIYVILYLLQQLNIRV